MDLTQYQTLKSQNSVTAPTLDANNNPVLTKLQFDPDTGKQLDSLIIPVNVAQINSRIANLQAAIKEQQAQVASLQALVADVPVVQPV